MSCPAPSPSPFDPADLPGEVGAILVQQALAFEVEHHFFAGLAQFAVAEVAGASVEFANEAFEDGRAFTGWLQQGRGFEEGGDGRGHLVERGRNPQRGLDY